MLQLGRILTGVMVLQAALACSKSSESSRDGVAGTGGAGGGGPAGPECGATGQRCRQGDICVRKVEVAQMGPAECKANPRTGRLRLQLRTKLCADEPVKS
jgi:hypothetical protein